MNNWNAERPLVVWFFTDDMSGHLSQMRGLESRLSAHIKIEPHWISIENKEFSWFDALLKRFSCENKPAPDLVVGAGRRTHKYVAATKRSYGCFALVLSRPSLPLSLFDAAVIPEHDTPTVKNNILVTVGVLNNVVPGDTRAQNTTNKRGLILIGGESKHYVWDDGLILQQLESIIANSSDANEWVLANSRRTPDSFLALLKEKKISKLKIVEHQNTDSSWLPTQMSNSQRIWVTPDSVSMVYEGITSGGATSIFKLNPKKETRVVKGVQQLLKKKLLSQWPDINAVHQTSVLWEAERTTTWLLDRLVKSNIK